MRWPLNISIIFVLFACLLSAPVCHAGTDHEKALVGTWEYRQAAGKSFDREGEILQITRNAGLLQGFWFGLERDGDEGLFYTAVTVKDVAVRSNGEVSFTVPARHLFIKRPKSVQEAEREKSRSAGFTRDELHMNGHLQSDKLTLSCASKGGFCPEEVMVFEKARRNDK